jgi:hypothetical protein
MPSVGYHHQKPLTRLLIYDYCCALHQPQAQHDSGLDTDDARIVAFDNKLAEVRERVEI